MTILVFGHTGQVATELGRLPGTRCLGREQADLATPEACVAAIREIVPRAVINAAAYTAVDRAEEEEELARLINATAPGAMALACADLNVPFVHISTDYVFEGSGARPWSPHDQVSPRNAYGRSKLAGERAVMAGQGVHVILRTSWVVSGHGTNFIRNMLRLGRMRDRLSVVSDQIGGPTPARALAQASMDIAEQLILAPAKTGIYHFAGTPDVSWAEFARVIFKTAGITCDVEDIASAEYPTAAERPLNSRLDCSQTGTVFGLKRPDWLNILPQMISELERGAS